MPRRWILGLAAAVAAGTVVACSSESSAPVDEAAQGQVAEATTAFVGYDYVRPEKVEEDSFVSDGDEIVFAVLKIRTTTGVANSTKWEWVTTSPGATGSTKAGNEATISDDSGDAWFRDGMAVSPLSAESFSSEDGNLHADVIMTLAFIFEEDNGITSEDISILNEIAGRIAPRFASVIEGAKIPVSDKTLENPALLQESMDALIKQLEAVSLDGAVGDDAVGQLIKRLGSAGFDPNDVIGIAATIFVPTDDGLIDVMEAFGFPPSKFKLLGPGEGDGNQAWTNYREWYVDKGFIGRVSGEVWYGLLRNSWVDDWMKVSSHFAWQKEVVYWVKISASMR